MIVMEAACLAADAQVDTWDRRFVWDWNVGFFAVLVVAVTVTVRLALEAALSGRCDGTDRPKLGSVPLVFAMTVALLSGAVGFLPFTFRSGPTGSGSSATYEAVVDLYPGTRAAGIVNSWIEPDLEVTPGPATLWVGDDGTFWVGVEKKRRKVTAARVEIEGLPSVLTGGPAGAFPVVVRGKRFPITQKALDAAYEAALAAAYQGAAQQVPAGSAARPAPTTSRPALSRPSTVPGGLSGASQTRERAPEWLKWVLLTGGVGVVVGGGVVSWRGARRKEEAGQWARSGRW